MQAQPGWSWCCPRVGRYVVAPAHHPCAGCHSARVAGASGDGCHGAGEPVDRRRHRAIRRRSVARSGRRNCSPNMSWRPTSVTAHVCVWAAAMRVTSLVRPLTCVGINGLSSCRRRVGRGVACPSTSLPRRQSGRNCGAVRGDGGTPPESPLTAVGAEPGRGGTVAQLAGLILAPAPHGSAREQRARMVGTGANRANAACQAADLDGRQPVRGGAVAELAIGVAAPADDATA